MRHSAPVPPRARPRSARRISVLGAGLTAVAAVSLAVASPALAAKGGGNTGSTTGSCVISPNPVPVDTSYIMSASGLGANTLVNVLVNDVQSVASYNLAADASGNLTLTAPVYWTGTMKVTIQKSAKHAWTTLATCSASVV